MSLVNEMLQDLAQRRESGDDDQVFSRLAPAPRSTLPRWRRWLLPAAVVLGAGLGVLIVQKPEQPPRLQTLPLPPAKVVQARVPVQDAAVPTTRVPRPEAPTTKSAAPAAPPTAPDTTPATGAPGTPAQDGSDAPAADAPALPVANAEALYRQGLSDARSGDIGAAIEAFAEAARAAPEMASVWRAWVSELLAMDDLARASQVLKRARAAVPGDPVLRELQARLWLQQGRLQAARALLERAPPPLHRHPNYHALLASLYQQTGDTRRAASTYRSLLATDAGVAVWWVGLAIALEGEAEAGAAARAYARALSLKTLPVEVEAFAANRHRLLVAGRGTGP